MSTSRDEMPEVNDDILDGLEGVVVLDFEGPRSLKNQVDSRLKELQASRSYQQFIVCRNVGKEQFTSMDQQNSLGRGISKSYHSNRQILVLKMPTTIQEAAHLTLWQKIWMQLMAMGAEEVMAPCGAGTFRSQSNISSKEADTAYKPATRTQKSDWPTIVLESGYSESMRRLVVDARWWLVNAGGDVKTVLLIWINGERQALHLERWCLAPPHDRPATRHAIVPTKADEVDIVAGNPRPYSRTMSVVPY